MRNSKRQRKPHLVSFSFVFSEQDDGVGQCGGRGIHLLHHHLPGAVDGQDVTRGVLAGPTSRSAGGARDWGEEETNVSISVVTRSTEVPHVTVTGNLLGVGGPPTTLTFICQ